MKTNFDLKADLLDGLVFTIGREGHIQLDDSTVSRIHAEIKIIQGRIYLRDLNSTNGTYVYMDERYIRFREGFIKPDTQLLIGSKLSTAESYLEKIGVSTSPDRNKTILSNSSQRKISSR